MSVSSVTTHVVTELYQFIQALQPAGHQQTELNLNRIVYYLICQRLYRDDYLLSASLSRFTPIPGPSDSSVVEKGFPTCA